MKHLSIISDDIILYLKDIYHGALIYEAFRKHKSESIETSLIEHIIEVINHEHIHKAIYDLLYTPKGFKELGMNKVNQEVIVILTCLEMKKLGG